MPFLEHGELEGKVAGVPTKLEVRTSVYGIIEVPQSSLAEVGDDMDLKWIIWQAVVPLTAPLLVWFAVSVARSTLRSTPKVGAHLKTFKSVVEEYGWLMYAVFLSLQCAVAIHDIKTSPSWIFWVNFGVLTASLLILGVAFVARFSDNGNEVSMKPSAEVQIERPAAAAVAIAAAIVGYFTFSAGKVL